MHDVIVIGLGAMGSAAACHLAQCGQRVLGIDQYTPPHTLGSSHGESRIIREAYFEHPLYVPLVQRAYTLWQALERDTHTDLLRVTGGLMLGHPDSVLIRGARASAQQHMLEHRIFGAAEVHARFPALHPDPDMIAVWEPRAGVLSPERCIAAQLQSAHAHGAELLTGLRITGWRETAGEVRVRTAEGEFAARQLLVSAGSWIGSLVPALADRFRVERQMLGWFTPLRDAEHFAPAACPIHLWESADGSHCYGFPDLGSGVKVARHHNGAATTPQTVDREPCAADEAALRQWMARHLPAANGPLRDSAVCLYTNTSDGHFWIDRLADHPRVLIASPCSGHGFKFASVIGELLADLLTERTPAFDLSLFRAR